MLLIRYEYPIKHEVTKVIYNGSFTLKEDADKTIVEQLNAHEVDRFEY